MCVCVACVCVCVFALMHVCVIYSSRAKPRPGGWDGDGTVPNHRQTDTASTRSGFCRFCCILKETTELQLFDFSVIECYLGGGLIKHSFWVTYWLNIVIAASTWVIWMVAYLICKMKNDFNPIPLPSPPPPYLIKVPILLYCPHIHWDH